MNNIDKYFIQPWLVDNDKLFMNINDIRIDLIHKKYSKGLSKRELIKLQKLQYIASVYLQNKRKPLSMDDEIRSPFASASVA